MHHDTGVFRRIKALTNSEGNWRIGILNALTKERRRHPSIRPIPRMTKKIIQRVKTPEEVVNHKFEARDDEKLFGVREFLSMGIPTPRRSATFKTNNISRQWQKVGGQSDTACTMPTKNRRDTQLRTSIPRQELNENKNEIQPCRLSQRGRTEF
jgi:hypothetical protein